MPNSDSRPYTEEIHLLERKLSNQKEILKMVNNFLALKLRITSKNYCQHDEMKHLFDLTKPALEYF